MRPNGKGDEGLARDLLPAADVDIEPRVDMLRIADLLSAASAAKDPHDRARLLTEARHVAAPNSAARALVEQKASALSAHSAAE